MRKTLTLGLLLAFAAIAMPALAETPDPMTVTGEVVVVDPMTKHLKLETDGESIVLQITDETKIVRDGQPIELGKVQVGDQATAQYWQGSKTHVALSIELKKADA